MIFIEEKPTKKVAGETSLFIKSSYNQAYVELFKTCGGSNYDKKNRVWEIPVIYLAKLIDEMCIYDSIELSILKDKKQKEAQQDIKLRKYKLEPFDYQKDGIKYGLTHPNWLLLDPPGLGKSAQLIHIAEELKYREGLKHCLIVCGLNTLKENWKKEISKHSDLSSRILGEKVSKTGRITIGSVQERLEQLKHPLKEFFIITNIETLRSNDIIKELKAGKHNEFDMIIVDEIHTCKSPTSQQGKNLLKLDKAKHKIGATGTVLLNSPLDAYVPLKWIGAENSTYTNFKYFYCNFGGQFHNILFGYKNTEILKEMLEKNSLRRPKETLNLPPKTIINEYVEMEESQRTFYDNIKKGIKDQVDKVKLTTSSLLAMTSRLRQATACPSILTTESIPSAKVDRACDLVDQIVSGGEKVVIFSTFKETVYALENRLKEYNPLIGTGDQKDEIISNNIDQFQTNPQNKCFIATWQKCGTGITLTAASYVIFIDVPWTNGVYEQAQDRCWRIGTKNCVTIYHLITRGTFDERVLEIVEDKSAISDYIVDDKITEKSLESLRKYIENL